MDLVMFINPEFKFKFGVNSGMNQSVNQPLNLGPKTPRCGVLRGWLYG